MINSGNKNTYIRETKRRKNNKKIGKKSEKAVELLPKY